MGYWITVYGTQSLGALSAEDLYRLVMRQDFMSIAEFQLGRDDEEEYGSAVEETIRVEPVGGAEGGFLLRYDPEDPDWFIRFDRHAGSEAREWGLAAIEEGRLDRAEPARIREVLATTEDHFMFNLKVRDQTGIGRFICWYLAMDLAGLGDGLVCTDHVEWWHHDDYSHPFYTHASDRG